MMSEEAVGESEIHKLLTDPTGWTSLLTFVVLALAWLVGFASRLFAVIRFESIIHEFDPWYVIIQNIIYVAVSVLVYHKKVLDLGSSRARILQFYNSVIIKDLTRRN